MGSTALNSATRLIRNDTIKSPKQLKQVHAHVLRRISNQGDLRFTQTKLLLTCASCSPLPNVSYSLSLFNQASSTSTNPFIWNTMIRILTLSNSPEQALSLYAKMRQRGLTQDTYTLTFTLNACSLLQCLFSGQNIHTQVVKTGLGFQAHVHSALTHFYAQCRLTELALKVFDEIPMKSPAAWCVMISAYAGVGELDSCWGLFDRMPQRDVVSWNAMIDACVQCGEPYEALRVFRGMEDAGFSANHITLLAILSACGEVGDLEFGQWIHSRYVSDDGKHKCNGLHVKTALIDMYSKCGQVDLAMDVFEGIEAKDTCAWTSIISGMAVNGRGDMALGLFNTMEKTKVRPDGATFVAVLCACSHAGLVKEGLHYFKSMKEDYGLAPRIEHYGCMVTIMGRAGYLQEAQSLIKTMPMEPNAVVWRSLLGACSMHGSMEMAEWAAKRLEVLERGREADSFAMSKRLKVLERGKDADSFVMLSNVYAEDGRWSEVERVRLLMKEKGRKKRWGCSSVHV